MALAGILVGCSAADPVSGSPISGRVGKAQLSVIGGQSSPESEDGIVKLQADTGVLTTSNCTATLVAPNLLLTALHCVAYFDSLADFECGADGALSTSPPGGSLGAPVDPESVRIWIGADVRGSPDAVGRKIFGSESTQICRNDIAAVVLDRDLDLPPSSLYLRAPVTRGAWVRVVGYSQQGVADAGSDRHTRSGVEITDVGRVASAAAHADGSAAPNTFVVGHGLCLGDSGGPAFLDPEGHMVGVYSISVGGTCNARGVRNVFTMLQPFESMILEAAAFAGHPVGVSDEPVPSEPAIPLRADSGVDSPRSGGDGSGSRRDSSLACQVAGPLGDARDASRPVAVFSSLTLLLIALWRIRLQRVVRRCP